MHDALFHSILAAPGDDMPRLVYADWLEENGDSARAEFIRLQIAGDPRADVILDVHRRGWIIPGFAGVQTFRRGFVEGLQIAAAEFVTHAERIGRLAPVTDLRLPVALDHLAAVAAVPWLDRLTHLDLTGNVGLGSRLDYFFGLADLPNLRSLELRNCQLWPEHASSLTRLAPRWPKLTRLNLSGNPLGDDGVTRLAGDVAFAKLEELSLRCDEQQAADAIHELGAAAIGQSDALRNLRHLDLNGHYIGDAGLRQLMRRYGQFVELRHLDLGYNDLGTQDFDPLHAVFMDYSRSRLQRLILDGNVIAAELSNSIEAWARHGVNEFVSLRDCEIDAEAYNFLRTSMYRHKIRFSDPSTPTEPLS